MRKLRCSFHHSINTQIKVGHTLEFSNFGTAKTRIIAPILPVKKSNLSSLSCINIRTKVDPLDHFKLYSLQDTIYKQENKVEGTRLGIQVTTIGEWMQVEAGCSWEWQRTVLTEIDIEHEKTRSNKQMMPRSGIVGRMEWWESEMQEVATKFKPKRGEILPFETSVMFGFTD